VGALINHRSGNNTIKSFTTNGQLQLTGGSLDISGSLIFNTGGSLLMNGGTLKNTIIQNPNLVAFEESINNVFDGVTLNGGITIVGSGIANGVLRIRNGLFYSSGTNFILRDTSTGFRLLFDVEDNGTVTFDNANVLIGGAIGFGRTSLGMTPINSTLILGSGLNLQGINPELGTGALDSTLQINTQLVSDEGGTWTLQPSKVVIGTTGIVEASGQNLSQMTINAPVFNEGIIRAQNGRGVVLNSGATQLGVIQANGAFSEVILSGVSNTTAFHAMTVSGGGSIVISGSLTNTGNTLDIQNIVGVGAANGNFHLDNGRIIGGSLVNANLLRFERRFFNILDSTTIDGLNLISRNNDSAILRIQNGLSYANGTNFFIGSDSADSLLFFDIDSNSTFTFDNANVVMGGRNGGSGFIGFGLTTVGMNSINPTLALGAGLNLQGKTANFGDAGAFRVTNSIIQVNTNLISDEGGIWTLNAGNIILNSNRILEANGLANSALTFNTPKLTNEATIRSAAPNTTVNINSANVVNNGTLEAVNGGQVNITGLSANAPLLNTGTINIGASSTIVVGDTNGNNSIKQTAGKTVVNGTLTLQGTGSTLEIMSGSLTGSGTINGGAVNNTGGRISPGESIGILTIGSNYIQGTGGKLLIELSGLSQGVTYDFFRVNGSIQLAGDLEIILLGGFTPIEGQKFNFIQYMPNNRIGNFNNIIAPSLGVNFALTFDDVSGIGTLTVVSSAAPEPSTFALLAFAAPLGLGLIRRHMRNKSQLIFRGV
jgi:hypothetical protein